MANMPPKAQLTGVISGRFLVFNATTMTLATTGPACSMTVLADLIKFSDL
jgi:hypothetical protein